MLSAIRKFFKPQHGDANSKNRHREGVEDNRKPQQQQQPLFQTTTEGDQLQLPNKGAALLTLGCGAGGGGGGGGVGHSCARRIYNSSTSTSTSTSGGGSSCSADDDVGGGSSCISKEDTDSVCQSDSATSGSRDSNNAMSISHDERQAVINNAANGLAITTTMDQKMEQIPSVVGLREDGDCGSAARGGGNNDKDEPARAEIVRDEDADDNGDEDEEDYDDEYEDEDESLERVPFIATEATRQQHQQQQANKSHRPVVAPCQQQQQQQQHQQTLNATVSRSNNSSSSSKAKTTSTTATTTDVEQLLLTAPDARTRQTTQQQHQHHQQQRDSVRGNLEELRVAESVNYRPVVYKYSFRVPDVPANMRVFTDPDDRRIEAIARSCDSQIHLEKLPLRGPGSLRVRKVTIQSPDLHSLEKCCRQFDDRFPHFYVSGGLGLSSKSIQRVYVDELQPDFT